VWVKALCWNMSLHSICWPILQWLREASWPLPLLPVFDITVKAADVTNVGLSCAAVMYDSRRHDGPSCWPMCLRLHQRISIYNLSCVCLHRLSVPSVCGQLDTRQTSRHQRPARPLGCAPCEWKSTLHRSYVSSTGFVSQIEFKLTTLMFQCVNGTAPGYLSSDVRRVVLFNSISSSYRLHANV